MSSSLNSLLRFAALLASTTCPMAQQRDKAPHVITTMNMTIWTLTATTNLS